MKLIHININIYIYIYIYTYKEIKGRFSGNYSNYVINRDFAKTFKKKLMIIFDLLS